GDRRHVEVRPAGRRNARIVAGRAALVRPLPLDRERERRIGRLEEGVLVELAGVAVLALELLEELPREVVVVEADPPRLRLRVRIERRLADLVAPRERRLVEGRVSARALRDDRVRDLLAGDV